MSSQSRRTFLKHAAAAGAAWGLADWASARGTAEKPFSFKFAMCNETFEGWPQKKIFQFLARCGYAGVEVAPFTINTDVTRIPGKERAQLRTWADEAGIRIVGLHWLLAKTTGLHLTSPDAEVRRKTTRYLAELARFCHDLGGDVLVFGSPQQRDLMPGVSRQQGAEYATEVYRGVVPVLEKTGVLLALEPLGPKTTNFMVFASDTVEIIERVDSPFCRLILDCKAMVTESRPIPELIRQYRQWLVHFHANDKNLRGPGMGEMDFVPVLQALREIQFRGWVSVEVFDYEPGAERLATESIRYLRQVERKVAG